MSGGHTSVKTSVHPIGQSRPNRYQHRDRRL